MIEISTNTNAEISEGSPFIVESCEFGPSRLVNYAAINLQESKILDWPMVYILANENTAYVGQTTSVATRMKQHGADESRQDFTTANIIFNEEFNASVVTDYEHRIIGLMHADGRYRLTNKNEGMTDSNYFSKARYSEMFESLWEELRRLELAEYSISQIEENEVFKYSPYKGLTPDQKVALDKILDAIESGLDNAKPIVVEGMPGTGKTVLAIFLLKLLKDRPEFSDMNIKLLEPVTSLRKTLRETLSSVSGLSSNDVISPTDLAKSEFGFKGPHEKSFDIVLVDEAHKLKRRVNLGTQFGNFDKACNKLGLDNSVSQVDWVLSQSRLPLFFYDPLQSIGPSCAEPSDMNDLIAAAGERPITLESQMRVKGGEEYLSYILDILNGENPSAIKFDNYEFVLHESIDSFVGSFEAKLDLHDLTRMMSGYAWKWISKNNRSFHDIVIDDIKLRWNCTYDGWVTKGVNDVTIAHEVGCIHSTQGYDLSYAYVIIGDDWQVDESTGVLKAVKNNYYDRNGKATATDEELDQYIKNIYYVLLTRGIYGTHVFAVNPKMREYLRHFFA